MGCAGERPPKVPAEAAAPAAAVAAPADSRADSGGTACVERGLEIREGARRTPVPLLYTRDLPRIVNDSTLSARLWTHCAAGPEYRVNLHTGQPVRAR